MIRVRNPNTSEWNKQKHFDQMKDNVKKHGYYIKSEEFYHPGYQQWFTTSNWVIGIKHNILRKEQLFKFRYSDGILTIFEYKKQDFQKVNDAATVLFGDVEGLDCIIENLYCYEV